MDETDISDVIEPESGDNKDLRPWLFKKGQSGNPKGRPKGSFSMKTYAKNMLEEMSDEERQVFLAGLDKKIIWEMAEGKPKQDIEADVTMTSKVISVDE